MNATHYSPEKIIEAAAEVWGVPADRIMCFRTCNARAKCARSLAVWRMHEQGMSFPEIKDAFSLTTHSGVHDAYQTRNEAEESSRLWEEFRMETCLRELDDRGAWVHGDSELSAITLETERKDT